jgi:2,5-diketo-D-gluconate reductase B
VAAKFLAMERKMIRNVFIPSIGLGTYELRGASCERSLATAFEIGYRHIDTAQMYENEEAIGKAIRAAQLQREQMFITTKVWPNNFSKKKFIPSVESSLKKLQLDQVDLLLLHWPADDETNKEATEFLLQCLEKKYARLIGVSNFSISQLKQAQLQAPVWCNQVRYHPLDQKHELLRYMQDEDLLLTAYSPLGLGKLSNRPSLADIAKRYNKTPNQLILRWLVQQKNIAAIPKAASAEHQKENMNIFDFELTDADMQLINRF